MEKYIKEIRETILDCWELDGMSSRYFDKLQNSLNDLESEVLKLHKPCVSNRRELLIAFAKFGFGDLLFKGDAERLVDKFLESN